MDVCAHRNYEKVRSSSKGDTMVPVDNRIELVRSIVAETTAKKNARARFYFAYNEQGKTAKIRPKTLLRGLVRQPYQVAECVFPLCITPGLDVIDERGDGMPRRAGEPADECSDCPTETEPGDITDGDRRHLPLYGLEQVSKESVSNGRRNIMLRPLR